MRVRLDSQLSNGISVRARVFAIATAMLGVVETWYPFKMRRLQVHCFKAFWLMFQERFVMPDDLSGGEAEAGGKDYKTERSGLLSESR